MLPIYIDESGINYQKKDGFFIDGPYILTCALLIPEEKYFHTERLFYDTVSRLLGVKDWKKDELHATDIWNKVGRFRNLSDYKVKRYFEELLQLTAKLKLPIVVGLQQKKPTRKRKSNVEIENSEYSLLTGMEHRLSTMNETAMLVCDNGTDSQKIQALLYDRTKWRYNPGSRKMTKYKTKFYYENQICFLIDQIHYVDSKDSLFVQLVDHLTYILYRVFTYSYLKNFPNQSIKIVPDQTHVPVSVNSFYFFANNVSICYFDETHNDITFIELVDACQPPLGANSGEMYLYKDWMFGFTPYK